MSSEPRDAHAIQHHIRRRFLLFGLGGVFIGTLLSFLTWGLSNPESRLALLSPTHVGSPWPSRIVLLLLGLVVVGEIPLMLWVLIRLVREGRVYLIINLTHVSYTAFPGVYALLGGVLTGQRWWVWPMLFVSIFRFLLSTLAIPAPTSRAQRSNQWDT